MSKTWNQSEGDCLKMSLTIHNHALQRVLVLKVLGPEITEEVIDVDQNQYTRPWNTGLELSEDHIRSLSESHKGQRVSPSTEFKPGVRNGGTDGMKIHSEEHKRHLSVKMTGNTLMNGRKLSIEWRVNQSKAASKAPKPKIACPHCGLIGGLPAMRQWHFDNCKVKDQ
jgi:hypothetical protein